MTQHSITHADKDLQLDVSDTKLHDAVWHSQQLGQSCHEIEILTWIKVAEGKK
jgi:hypothetical protein